MRVAILPVGYPNFRYDYAEKNLKKCLERMKSYEIVCCGKVLIDEKEIQDETERLCKAAPDVLLLVCGTYSYGSVILHVNEVMRDVPLILVGFSEPRIEGFNGLPLNSLCALNMYASFLKRFDKEFEYVYGSADDDGFFDQLSELLDAYRVRSLLKGVKFGVIGGRVPGFYLSDIDELNLKNRLGVDISRYSLAELFGDMDSISKDKVDAVLSEMKESAQICLPNESYLEKTARMVAVIREYAKRDCVQGFAIKCWPDLQKCEGISACAAVSYLNNGGIMTACEGDVPALLTQYIQYLYTGTPCFLADLVNVNENGSVKTWHCGPAAACLAGSRKDVRITMHPTMKDTGPAMNFGLKHGRVTVMKLSECKGELRMLVLGGNAVSEDRPMIANQCDIKFDHSVEEVMNLIMREGIEHHYCVVFEDVREQMQKFTRAAGIRLLTIGEKA